MKDNKQIQSIAKNIKLIVFDFDGVFTDNRVLVLQNGIEGVLCCRADGIGIEAVKKIDINLFVLSKEKNEVVSIRCKKLDIPCIQGCDNKSEILKQEADKLGIPLKNVAYMGNDINDLECIKMVGLPVCVSDSYPDIRNNSLFITKAKGGYGAVREFCDFIVRVKNERLS
ncbi:MAG: HAD hydrolase family protein [Actinobacteria bacterium]|nr:HAD hydrolase family protein [Actinomycetota bacterium]